MTLDLEIATSSRTSRGQAGRWLHRLLTQLVQQSARDIHKVPKWEEQAIHSLRKRMKKLQAMIQFARPVTPAAGRQKLREDIRKLKNLLSSNRDALVMTKLAHQFGISISFPSSRMPPPTTGRMKKAISLGEQLIINIGLLDLSHLTWEMVGRVYAKSYKGSRRAWRKAQQEPTPENFHEWRKKVKQFYYQSAALEPWFHHPKRLRHTRKLGSLLGDCHDLDVFSAAVKAGKLMAAPGWDAKVRKRRSKLLSRIDERADRTFSRTPRKIRHDSQHRLESSVHA